MIVATAFCLMTVNLTNAYKSSVVREFTATISKMRYYPPTKNCTNKSKNTTN